MVPAAIVTGGSSGIGLAIARVLAEEGYGLTLVARRLERLELAADELRARGTSVLTASANLAQEQAVVDVVEAHGRRFGRLDVLVNNAGVGIGAPVAEISAKQLDLQFAVGLRAAILFYRECAGLLQRAAAERGQALVVNTASLAGLDGQPWLSVYSAVKAGVIAFTQSMNKELGDQGVKSCALCPGTVDTEMTSYVAGDREWMLPAGDVAEGVRLLLRLSPACLVPQLVFVNAPRAGSE